MYNVYAYYYNLFRYVGTFLKSEMSTHNYHSYD